MSILNTITNVILHIAQKTDAKNFAVYQSDGETNTEVFVNVQIINAAIQDDAHLMEHPIESGAVITDHEIFNPNSVSLQVLISDDDSSSLSEIQEFYKKGTPLTVKAKGEIYSNLVISGKPYKISSTYFDKTLYDISFKGVLTASTQYVKMTTTQVRHQKNASTKKTGQKQAQKKLYKSVSDKLIPGNWGRG